MQGEGVEFLLSMGFSRKVTEEALSRNDTIESAVEWAVENQAFYSETYEAEAMASTSVEELKMVLVIRDDLAMSPGKVAAQCVHAALGACRRIGEYDPQRLISWEMSGEATICLRCTSQTHMEALSAAANNAGLPSYVVSDAGRTEVEPGSMTVLAIGPARKSKIDEITGRLRLY
jgi:PTH2 family peptidyl-tRNA hydrolase